MLKRVCNPGGTKELETLCIAENNVNQEELGSKTDV
jgi:hypothetical protein